MNSILSTLLHVIELVVAILLGWTICQLFQLQNEDIKVIVSLILAAFAKYLRASDLPVQDYVNGKKE